MARPAVPHRATTCSAPTNGSTRERTPDVPEIQVNLPSLQNGATGVQQLFNRLQSTLDQLDADLKPMIESWSGAAQESYLTYHRQWTEAAASLATVLNHVGSSVGAAYENYSTTHQATIRVWA
jgi:6 kDa early secretory antigenic target